jgi:hypothetical protein
LQTVPSAIQKIACGFKPVIKIHVLRTHLQKTKFQK